MSAAAWDVSGIPGQRQQSNKTVCFAGPCPCLPDLILSLVLSILRGIPYFLYGLVAMTDVAALS